MNKTFALFAAVLMLAVPVGTAYAQELGSQAPERRYIDRLHFVLTGLEVDKNINVMAVSRMIAGDVKSTTATATVHRVGVYFRKTADGTTKFHLRGLSVSEGTVSGTIFTRDKQEVGSFEITRSHLGDAEYWKGTITLTVDGTTETTTFLGKGIRRAYKAIEKARLIAKHRTAGEEGTDDEVEIKAYVKEAPSDVRARIALREKCTLSEKTKRLCAAELNKIGEKDPAALAKRLRILSNARLTDLQLNRPAVTAAEKFLSVTQVTRIKSLQIARPQAFISTVTGGAGTGNPDFNGDGYVDSQDLDALLKNWGDCTPSLTAAAAGCPWDLNKDGIVGVTDLLTLLAAWNSPGGENAPSLTTVNIPTTVA